MDLDRLKFLDQFRARKMARSIHAYVRGNTATAGPPVWICGELTASHEAGYLEHCRRHALSDAA
ncbi:MAG TPA: hypothetical protein VF463_08295 [Sphingobium sp.]